MSHVRLLFLGAFLLVGPAAAAQERRTINLEVGFDKAPSLAKRLDFHDSDVREEALLGLRQECSSLFTRHLGAWKFTAAAAAVFPKLTILLVEITPDEAPNDLDRMELVCRALWAEKPGDMPAPFTTEFSLFGKYVYRRQLANVVRLVKTATRDKLSEVFPTYVPRFWNDLKSYHVANGLVCAESASGAVALPLPWNEFGRYCLSRFDLHCPLLTPPRVIACKGQSFPVFCEKSNLWHVCAAPENQGDFATLAKLVGDPKQALVKVKVPLEPFELFDADRPPGDYRTGSGLPQTAISPN